MTNATVNAGTYTLSESGGPAGYTAGAWSCTAGTLTGASWSLPLNGLATCTINNNDQPAHADPGQDGYQRQRWHRSADRLDAVRGRSDADHRHDRVRRRDQRPGERRHLHPSESGGPAGYTAGAWSCTGGTLTGASRWCCRWAQRHLHHQQQRPAGPPHPGQDRDQRQRRYRLPTAWTLTATGPTPITGSTGIRRVTNVTGQRRHLHAVRSPAGRPATRPAPGPAPAAP